MPKGVPNNPKLALRRRRATLKAKKNGKLHRQPTAEEKKELFRLIMKYPKSARGMLNVFSAISRENGE